MDFTLTSESVVETSAFWTCFVWTGDHSAKNDASLTGPKVALRDKTDYKLRKVTERRGWTRARSKRMSLTPGNRGAIPGLKIPKKEAISTD